jgi:carbon monoxide dehydrogenase subunit G
MASYSFTTHWRVEAPIDRVWDAIHDVERYPAWWPNVRRVEKLAAGDERGVGARTRFVYKSRLPYLLEFETVATRVERPHLMEVASRGELEGTGRWTLSQDGPVTVVRYDWNVRTTRRWMDLLAPIARPLFEWNHHVSMRDGGRGLARLLGARLLGVSSQPTPPARPA